MASLVVGVAEGLRRSVCAILAAQDYVNGAIGSIYPPGSVLPGIAITALRRFNGCNPADDPAPPAGAFTGGQCAVAYRIILSVNNPSTGVPVPGSPFDVGTRTGPLELTRNTPAPAVCNSPNVGRASREMGPVNGGQNPILLVNAACSTFDQFGGVVVQRIDGLPDDCGGPPPIVPPPIPIERDVNVTYINNEGDTVNLTLPFIFAPIVTNLNGDFNIPFTFDFGGVEFSGNMQIEPNFNVTINPPAAPRGTDSPFTDLPAPNPEIEVEPRPPGQRVIGVVVQAQLVGEQQITTISTTDIPPILAPRCGSVKFGYVLNNRSWWSPDIDIKDLNCFIPCPFSQGADAVAASPAPGVSLGFAPIFGDPLATMEAPPSTPEP